jgi:murein DD-endopeptidase MepM/ murein hydrolase activator NlpD
VRIVRVARRLWFLGLLGLVPLVDPRLRPLRFFVLFFFAPLAVGLLVRARRPARPREEAASAPERPLPGPAERSGPLLFLLRVLGSSLLVVLNPFQLAQTFRQSRGDAAAGLRVVDAAAAFRQSVEYTLPFEGEWLVTRGGVTPGTSHSWGLAAQRFAYDFVVADAERRSHAGDGSRLEDYLAYGRPVLAPADGTVEAVNDGVRDAPRPGTGWLDWRVRDFRGNWVVLRHGEGEYSLLAHLVPGSVRVRPGGHVKRGDVLGLCGSSGHSTEPHLHFQVQDHADFFRAAGLPVAFSGCVVDGAAADGPVYLRAGMRVRPAESAPEVAGPPVPA